MKKTGKLVGVCNCICHCGLEDCFTEHDKSCEHCVKEQAKPDEDKLTQKMRDQLEFGNPYCKPKPECIPTTNRVEISSKLVGEPECTCIKFTKVFIIRPSCPNHGKQEPKEDWEDELYNIADLGGDISVGDAVEFIRKTLQKERESIKDRLEKLMDKKQAKKICDNLEKFTGSRDCKMCGCNPERQREMLLSNIEADKKT